MRTKLVDFPLKANLRQSYSDIFRHIQDVANGYKSPSNNYCYSKAASYIKKNRSILEQRKDDIYVVLLAFSTIDVIGHAYIEDKNGNILYDSFSEENKKRYKEYYNFYLQGLKTKGCKKIKIPLSKILQ